MAEQAKMIGGKSASDKNSKKMTKKQYEAYYDKTGEFHDTDPANPMNSELTGPSTLSIIIATPKPKPKNLKKQKNKMAYGGMANGRKHMYLGGDSSVKDNAGLRALKKASPAAYNKIKGI